METGALIVLSLKVWRTTVSKFILLVFVFVGLAAQAKTVRYELTITQERVNLSGKKTVDWALMVNKSIPAPILEFTEGDEAEILVKNGLHHEEVSIHWHGILLPPEEDGVAYVNTPPIHPGQSHLFKFKLRQHGTYWYHSHTAVQEQKGVYGAFIVRPKKEIIKADKDVVAVLSDWSDENADQIMRNLRKDGDYYLYKKNSMRSIGGALMAGRLGTYFGNEWQRMGGMDLSDVGYDAFLLNGKRDSQLSNAKAGERVRVRVINASASSYFFVSLSGLPMKVISADGLDIEPIEAKEILMGMAETYDVLFTVPESKNFELRATVQDVTGYASGWIGSGEKVPAPNKALPDYYAPMDHGSGHGEHSGHDAHAAHAAHAVSEKTASGHEHHDHGGHGEHQGHTPSPPALETLSVDDLMAKSATTLPKQAKVTEMKLVLGGDMERYVWHINGKAIHQDRNIEIREGDVVRFTFVNETMMHHPMHLHGHFFRVLNKHGERSPLKHTVDVPPHGTRTIEFYANEAGQWMLHCHNLYHMKTGMGRVVKYMSWQPKPENARFDRLDPHRHDHLYMTGLLEAATNHARANFRLMRTWDELDLKIESRSDGHKHFAVAGRWDVEGDLLYKRWFGNFFNLIAGGTVYHEETFAMVGVGYILPMLIDSHLFVNHEGRFRLDLEKRFQWTKRVFSEIEYSWRPDWGGDNEHEIEVTLMYGPSWHWSAGVMLTNDSLGVGAQIQY